MPVFQAVRDYSYAHTKKPVARFYSCVHIHPMNAAAKKADLAAGYRARANARAIEDRRARLAAPLQGRTLETAQSVELESDERRERMARTAPAFEGL